MQSIKVWPRRMGKLSKHGVKQVDRLLSNEGIDVERFFGYWVAYMVGARLEIVVALDGSVANSTKTRGGRAEPGGAAQASARSRWFCSHAMVSVTTHGPTPKARSTIRASPMIPPWMENIAAWPLRSARITSKPLIVA